MKIMKRYATDFYKGSGDFLQRLRMQDGIVFGDIMR